MEQARTAVGEKLDDDDRYRPAGRYYDCWERECTFGRWAELVEARSKPELAEEAGVSFEDQRWWQLARTEIGDVAVSTVWLGLNHNFNPAGPPIIYETMVIGGTMDGEMERYSQREEAAAGHERTVRLVRMELDATSETRANE